MRNGATSRIGIWASVGFLVAVCWGIYFATSDKENPIGPIVYSLSRLTAPVAWALTVLNPNLPLGLSWVVVANAATYALVGLIVETALSARS